jgi:hypothetical protein
VTQDGKSQVAVGHNAGKPLWVAHQDGADMIVGHGARGLIGFGLAVEGDELGSAKALKRHGEASYAARMANEASPISDRFRLKLP